jgi:branched-chain amino acid transport system substrate-binding protein
MEGGKWTCVFCFFWLFVLVYPVWAQGSGQAVRNANIRLGILCTLSGSASSTGRHLLEGLQTFFHHVNHIGGIHERRILLLARDDGGDPDQGAAVARRMLVEDEVFAFACTSGVPTTQALIDQGILGDTVPALAGAALSKLLFSRFMRNVFFLGMPYGDQIALAIEYLLKAKPGVNPRMGLLCRQGFLGEEVQEGFRRVCSHYGLQIVAEALYGQDMEGFSPFVNRLRSAQADHVILGATPGEAAEIMRQASQVGWFPQFIGPSSTADPEILATAEEGADNYLVVDYLARPWERLPGVTLMKGNTERHFPRKDVESLHRCHILGYVSGLLVAESLERTGGDLSREAFIRAFERIDTLDTHGLTGVIGYRPDSRLSGSSGRVFRFDRASGRLLPLTEWRYPMMRSPQ